MPPEKSIERRSGGALVCGATTEPRAVASGSMAVRRDTRSLPLAVLYQNFKLEH